MDFSLILLAGGQSQRMGQDKRFLRINGLSFLERLLKKASAEDFVQIVLSIGQRDVKIESLAQRYHAKICVDIKRDEGPLCGLATSLAAIPTPYALAISCDMPFYDFQLYHVLRTKLQSNESVQALLLRVQGHIEPLASLYQKTCAPLFFKALQAGERKLQNVCAKLHCAYWDFPQPIPELFNVNRPADLRLARGRALNLSRTVPIVTISAAHSGTGKTTFIEKLLPRFVQKGLRVGVVKSDAHGFQIDTKGKDSDRFMQAGAQSVAVVSSHGYFLQEKRQTKPPLTEIAAKIEGVQLILIESRAHGLAPVICLYREGELPTIGENVAAVFAKEKISFKDVPVFSLDDIEKAMEVVCFLAGCGRIDCEFQEQKSPIRRHNDIKTRYRYEAPSRFQ